jgi:hypothetical protein
MFNSPVRMFRHLSEAGALPSAGDQLPDRSSEDRWGLLGNVTEQALALAATLGLEGGSVMRGGSDHALRPRRSSHA